MKNKRIKIVALLLVLCLLTTLLTACTSGKTFTKDEFSITLPKRFVEREVEGAVAAYTSLSVGVVVAKEYKKDLVDIDWDYEINTADDYASYLLGNTYPKQIYNKETYSAFYYRTSVNGKEIFAYVTTHESDDAFWLVIFICKARQRSRFIDKFDQWAASVTFNNTPNLCFPQGEGL